MPKFMLYVVKYKAKTHHSNLHFCDDINKNLAKCLSNEMADTLKIRTKGDTKWD